MTIKKILVIEDNALNMKLVVTLLKLSKYEIIEAKDAEDGLKLAQKHRPNLILMDIQLPGMNGLHATRVIKGDAELKDVPVVALTSYVMEGDKERIIEAGCDGDIPKPIDTRRFLETISAYLN